MKNWGGGGGGGGGWKGEESLVNYIPTLLSHS